MTVIDTPVTHRERDFQDVLGLLTRSYTLLGDVNTWSFCRFASWIVYTAPEDLTQHLHLWREADGRLVGFAVVDGGRDVWVVTHPAYRDIEGRIFTWVEQAWPGEGDLRITYAEAGDTRRRAVLASLGYREAQAAETMRKYDLARVARRTTLEPGFVIHDITVDYDITARGVLSCEVFHPGEALPEGLASREHLMAFYDPTLDLAVFSPEGKRVAYATGWYNPENGSAEVEPVGTHPDYRRRGFAKAVVTEAFKRLAERGAKVAHIASDPEPATSNVLYDGLGPVSKQHFIRWVKP